MRIAILHAALLLGACTAGSSNDAPTGDDPLHFGSAKHSTTFGQRDTQTVPNTVGRLSIVVGDVEGLNLVESIQLIDHKDEQTILDTTDFRVGKTKSFEVDGTRYQVELLATDSTHILNDTATFEFSLVR